MPVIVFFPLLQKNLLLDVSLFLGSQFSLTFTKEGYVFQEIISNFVRKIMLIFLSLLFFFFCPTSEVYV